MTKHIIKNTVIFLVLMLSQATFAKAGSSGPLFNIQGTGDLGGTANITLCLNANGPLSCQHYVVTNTNLSITTTTPNHTYPAAGIISSSSAYKINTSTCTLLSNGYCSFSANSQTPTTIAVTTTAVYLTATPSTDTEVNVAYSQTNVASGGTTPYVYSVSAGTLPVGTTLNTTTGTVSGAPATAGSFSYTITVTDNDGATATAPTSGTITGALSLTATPSTDTEVNVAYSQTNVANGGATPYVYSVSAGTLPAGATLNTGTGTVSGTPTTSGSFSYTIKVTDNDGATATAPTSGTIIDALTLTATPSTDTEVGVAYSQTNVASGGTTSYVYSISSGTLPAGTTLNTGTGTVSGIPSASGSFSYTIQVVDTGGGVQTAATSGSIYATLTITPTSSIFTEKGVAYSQTNAAGGGHGTYTYSLASGSLPAGTTLSTSTGTVSGTPSTPGSFFYTINVVDQGGGSATTSLISGTIYLTLTITPTNSASTQVGVFYSQTNVASGGHGTYTYSLASGSLPAGTTLSTSTGTVSGTPSASGSFSYTINVVDQGGGSATTGTISGSISLGNQTVSFTSTTPSMPTIGSTYTPTATSTSGLIVTITVDATSSSGVCSISGGVVSFNAIGTCILDANQAGNANYNAATQVQQIMTIASLMPQSYHSNDFTNEVISSNASNNAAISSDQLTSISCPSTSFCMAVDTDGAAFRYDGTSWASADKIDTGRSFKSVSCSSPSYCVAIDTSGYAFIYNGTWGAGSQLDTSGELISVSCPNSSFCMVIDNNAHAFAYNGKTWGKAEAVGIASALTAISCISNTECMAVDAQGNGSYYDGTVWTAYRVNPISTHGLNSISCTPNSGSFCMAVDNAGNAFSYNGTNWTSQDDNAHGSEPLSTVSCLGNAFCMAVNTNGGALRYNGVTWSTVSDIDEGRHSITSLSCPTSAFCMGVDKEGNAWKYNASVANINMARTNSSNDDTSHNVIQTFSVTAKNNTATTYNITRLNKPEGVYIDTNNNLWIADTAAGKVYRLPASTNGDLSDDVPALITITNPASTSPAAVVTDSDGNIYVADHNNAMFIYPAATYQAPGKYDDATPSRTIIGKSTGLNNPLALALDNNHNIWVTNKDSNSIEKFAAGIIGDSTNMKPDTIISGASTLLDEPNGLFIDKADNIWVTNTKVNAIYVFAAGTVGNTAPTCVIRSVAINTPAGITLDSQGNIYQANNVATDGFINIFEPVSAICGTTMLSPVRRISGAEISIGQSFGLSLGYVF